MGNTGILFFVGCQDRKFAAFTSVERRGIYMIKCLPLIPPYDILEFDPADPKFFNNILEFLESHSLEG